MKFLKTCFYEWKHFLLLRKQKQIYIPSEGGVYWKIRLFNSIKTNKPLFNSDSSPSLKIGSFY